MVPPDHELGVDMEKVQTQDEKVLWEIHFIDYCKAAIEYMYKTLTADGKILS